jgi:histone acetyltransferase (RNA polymerase elongator complex component)
MMKTNNHRTETAIVPLIIPIFVMNSGCPHRCIFCNQKITAGNFPPEISRDFFEAEVTSYLNWNKDKSRRVEIAFYGGSFTGIAAGYQSNLLQWAQSYIQAGLVQSIRISTRPDYINTDIVANLRKNNVTTVEIGAQSFVDEVLRYAQRGHSAADITHAIRLLKESGLQTGIHLMAGLPKDSLNGFTFSLERTIELKPDTVRIHPVVVFRDTILAREFKQGNYRPLSLPEAISYCRLAWGKLTASGIRIIRTGLHLTNEMEEPGAVLAGPLHPAFGNLVLSALFYERINNLLENLPDETKELCFYLSPRDVSNFRGLNNSNIKAIKKLYPRAVINVRAATEQKRGLISMETDQGLFLTTETSGIP